MDRSVQLHSPGRFDISVTVFSTNWIGDWLEFRAGLDAICNLYFPLCKIRSASFTSQHTQLIFFRSEGLGRPSRLAQVQAPISNLTEICPVVAALLHSNRRTDRHTDWWTKLISAFHYYANASKKKTWACTNFQLDLNTGLECLNGLRSTQNYDRFKNTNTLLSLPVFEMVFQLLYLLTHLLHGAESFLRS